MRAKKRKKKETYLVEGNVDVPADETLDPLLVLFGDGAVPTEKDEEKGQRRKRRSTGRKESHQR
jgi:hypothetical protein